MKRIIWKILERVDSNWGYSTPIQKRFKVGDRVGVSIHKKPETPFGVDEIVWIIETGRYDYLVENSDGTRAIVYQFELTQ